jgi:plastocyanin
MGRGAICLAIAATLVATAVAVGAGADVRLHRLHVPPPPTVDVSDVTQPPAPGAPAPPATPPPAVTAPPATPPPPGPPPPAGIGCTGTGGGTPVDATGSLSNFAIALSPTTVASAATLRFRAVNQAAGTTHNLWLRATTTGTDLCGTPNLAGGAADTFAVTNLPPGSYVLYCRIHPVSMQAALTVS